MANNPCFDGLVNGDFGGGICFHLPPPDSTLLMSDDEFELERLFTNNSGDFGGGVGFHLPPDSTLLVSDDEFELERLFTGDLGGGVGPFLTLLDCTTESPLFEKHCGIVADADCLSGGQCPGTGTGLSRKRTGFFRVNSVSSESLPDVLSGGVGPFLDSDLDIILLGDTGGRAGLDFLDTSCSWQFWVLDTIVHGSPLLM